ncbi:MAG TPA: hypothetical protein DEB39_10155 [Planctomycetaceae bacterium]|nr:hypothetical protein [Planctomycetaceae bacterium]
MRTFPVRIVFAIVFVATLVPVSGCAPSMKISTEPYLERRAVFRTQLTRTGPAPQEWEPVALIPNVRKIEYPSGDLRLQGWVQVPPEAETKPAPALVYFHGGFAFGMEELESCSPFRDAGFVVFCPTLRGENGNPGNFEFLFGEIDDAANAVRWLADQPYVDKNRIYTFGHSAGGGVSALLSLMDDVPIRHGGSSGGLYDHGIFNDTFAPFNGKDASECAMRTLYGNQRWMKRKHYGFVGPADYGLRDSLARLKKERETLGRDKSLLVIGHPKGDHFSSLEPALRRYLAIIKKENILETR